MKNKLTKFVEDCKVAFTERLVSIINHGSATGSELKQPQDIDVVIILRDKTFLKGDIQALRSIVAPIGHILDIQLFYTEELPQNADLFSQNTNGCFFSWHLRSSAILYGQNVFDLMHGPSLYQVRLSLLQKIRQYAHRIRKQLILDKPIETQADIHNIAKILFKMVKDILMMKMKSVPEQKIEALLLIFQEICPDVLDSGEFSFLSSISVQEHAWLDDTEQLKDITYRIAEKLYQEALLFAGVNLRFCPITLRKIPA